MKVTSTGMVVGPDGYEYGWVEKASFVFHDHKRPGQTITRRGWQAVRPSQLAQWSAGQFINLYPARREAVAYLTGKDAE